MPSGLRVLKLVAGGIDQRAGFAVHAGDGVGSERSNRAEAVQQNVVGDRLHDTGHARHVELERADAELLGVTGDFIDLLFREDLRMEDEVDVAALVHRLAEGGQMIEVRILQAAQENPDAGDAAEDRRAGLGLGFVFVGLLVADMDVRVENSGQNCAPGGVIGFSPGVLQVVADHGDLAVGDPDVGLDPADAGNDQRAIANNEVERFAVAAFRHDLTFRYAKSSWVSVERATSRPFLNTCRRGGCTRRASCVDGAPTTTRLAVMPGAIP